MSTRTKIGAVNVDSGSLMIVDPCHIDGAWDSKPPKGGIHSKSYLEVMSVLDQSRSGPILHASDGKTGLGICLSTEWGDGEYEVFSVRGEQGELEKIEIVLAQPFIGKFTEYYKDTDEEDVDYDPDLELDEDLDD